jgi:uncharacterized protein involved in cysteine biosynthesis
MEDLILTALTYSAIIWVILSWIKAYINPTHKIYRFLCLKCITFWLILVLTFNLPLAAVAALIGAIIDNYIDTTSL